MTARDNTPLPPLRDRIESYLASVEYAFATDITAALKMQDLPAKVIHALNAMRTDGIVECETRGKHRAYAYWLTAKSAPAPEPVFPAGIRPGTRNADIWIALGDGSLAVGEMEAKIGVGQGVLDQPLNVMLKTNLIGRTKGANGVFRYHKPHPAVGNNTGSDASEPLPSSSEGVVVPQKPQTEPVLPPSADLSAGDVSDEMPPADPALLASANRMLSGRLAGVAHALRGSGLPALANIDDGEDLQMHVAALAGAYQMALDDRDNLMSLVDVLKRNLDSKSHECGSLREHVAKHPSTGGDVIGYYVIEKSMPDCDTLDDAIQTATAYIHDGAAKCEIIAACRVGAVERKAEWVPA